jgi:eukaryotic-like serine/threonine-protein kinase
VGKLLGAGGFGAVYQVAQLGRAKTLRGDYCLKVAVNPTYWHREAYFGDLFRYVPGVIRIHGSFAWIPRGHARKPLYCLITEFAEGGDLAHYLENHPEPWKESQARREIIRLLRIVTLLHDAGAVHRDITPTNVFVTSKQVLKLGDFGIASHRVGKHHVLADIFAPWFAPDGMSGKAGAIWRPADDVFHLGQLFAMLLCGCAKSKLAARAVKNLACTSEAKSIIQRCIGQRRKRFPNAASMLSVLERQEPDEAKRVVMRSLKGKHVVFSGPLSITRSKAERLVRRVGGIVERRINHCTDVLVVGGISPLWKADTKGQKLLDLDHENEIGHKIPVIREARFRILAGAAPSP